MREKQKHYELKNAIAYEGWEPLEGNESNMFAHRMKDRGMSWTIKGAQHMGKAIQLAFNGELDKWCGRRPPAAEEQKERLSFDLLESESGSHARGQLPALVGPHAARHWVTGLKNMVANTHRLL